MKYYIMILLALKVIKLVIKLVINKTRADFFSELADMSVV